jgi:hypothetical protein
MRALLSAALVIAAILTAPLLATAHPETHDPLAILRAAKTAAGGRALDRAEGSYEEGRHGDTIYRTWLNFKRYGMKSESIRNGVHRTIGFNGQVQWNVGPDGKVSTKSDDAALREAIVTAYVSNNGYFYPDRFPAEFHFLRVARADGRAFDVIEVEPKGGRAVQLWIDRRSHLVSRLVDEKGSPPVSVEISDYRRVGGALIAFRGTVRTLDGKVVDKLRVGSVTFKSLPSTTFDPPAESSK